MEGGLGEEGKERGRGRGSLTDRPKTKRASHGLSVCRSRTTIEGRDLTVW